MQASHVPPSALSGAGAVGFESVRFIAGVDAFRGEKGADGGNANGGAHLFGSIRRERERNGGVRRKKWVNGRRG
ncbi:hypothetical protein GCM10009000_044550 [Halobacterium noricense]|uniref:Uncharacterized protein n=1 Tax=Haladaptatus pallidirubidus TaxID=1008152 RepID=A0AAV3UFA2_9EURY